MASTTAPVPPLVLASRSPRRKRLLEMLGFDFDIRPAAIDESAKPDELPTRYVERLAREKALAVARERPEALVLGCDTVVCFEGELLGKPGDEGEAVDTLVRLSGQRHRVETGIAIAGPGNRLESSVEGVHVHFRPFTREDAEAYVATGEPMDKAGAYGIQGYGATLVNAIEGDYFAVMGLPIARMVSLFRALGYRYNYRGLERM